MGLGDPEVKLHLLPKAALLHHLDSKIHPELGKNGRFLIFLHGELWVLGGDVIPPFRIVALSQNCNSM